jgi:hypothetical protein
MLIPKEPEGLERSQYFRGDPTSDWALEIMVVTRQILSKNATFVVSLGIMGTA